MNLKFPNNNEFSLLQNLREDDINAFRFIYNSHYRPLYHFAIRFIKDSHQAEDIITECFISLWQKRKEFETFKGLVAFLYTCTKNGCLSHLKKVRRHETSHLEIAYLFDQSEVLDNADAIKNDLIQCSIIESENLPPAMKKVFQLLYIEGFKTTEIAQKLHLSVNTVRAQKANAIKRVRENLLKKGLLGWLF
jgi:RNA polymerase sigma-70 factor (family 1)